MTTPSVFTPTEAQEPSAQRRAMSIVSRLAGVSLDNPLDEVILTQRGIEPGAMESLKELGAISAELHWIIKPRTLAHRRSRREVLTQEETGRWLRAAKIQALALEVFGNQAKAVAWLHKPRVRFGNQSASDLIQTEAGSQLVEDTLNQIDAGYFA